MKLCGYGRGSKNHLSLSYWSWVGDYTFRVPISQTLYRHMKQEHLQAKPYQCVTCSSWFNTFHDRRVHMNTVHASEILKCDHCNFSTYNRFCLENHKWMHSNTKLQCEHCDVTLSSKGVLTEHLKWHFDQNNYPCDRCDKTFASSLSRKIHIVGKHSPGYICLECGQRFDSTSQLAKHKRWCGKVRSKSPEY